MMSDRSYWERHAQKYDTSMRFGLGKPISPMLELVSEAVHGKGRVLEVAAGTGIVTTAIAQRSETVVATDYAAAMVGVLTQRVTDAGLENVRCEQADIYKLPYAEGEFDAVVAANVLHLVPDFDAAIAALRWVLKPEGVLIAPTFCHDETRISWLVSRVLALSGFPGQRRFTIRSLTALLEDNGLEVKNSKILPGPIPIGYVEGVFGKTEQVNLSRSDAAVINGSE